MGLSVLSVWFSDSLLICISAHLSEAIITTILTGIETTNAKAKTAGNSVKNGNY